MAAEERIQSTVSGDENQFNDTYVVEMVVTLDDLATYIARHCPAVRADHFIALKECQ